MQLSQIQERKYYLDLVMAKNKQENFHKIP